MLIRLVKTVIDICFTGAVLGLLYMILWSPSMIIEKEDYGVWTIIEEVDKLDEYSIRFKEVVFAQAVHETNNFKSAIYRECNNLFGMKVAHRRLRTSISTCRNHAYYDSRVNSVKDYALWQMNRLPIYEFKVLGRHCETQEEYMKFLKWAGYAEDHKYIRKVKEHLKNLQ